MPLKPLHLCLPGDGEAAFYRGYRRVSASPVSDSCKREDDSLGAVCSGLRRRGGSARLEAALGLRSLADSVMSPTSEVPVPGPSS